MPPYSEADLHARFRTAADDVAASRPGVDLDVARELMDDAATMLHDSLALDSIDARDASAVVDGLAEALTAPDPGAALRARAVDAASDGGLHDAQAASAAYLSAAQVLQV
jgi:hypothetical protein